jgi:membrane-associated protein
MELAHFLINFILHVDKHLAEFVQNYGMWVYALLFLIVFVETGLVVMPFLPGDSLLFVVGALAARGHEPAASDGGAAGGGHCR